MKYSIAIELHAFIRGLISPKMLFSGMMKIFSKPTVRPFSVSVRCLSEVIDLSPSEISRNDDTEGPKKPAKHPFQKLDTNPTVLSQVMMKVKSKKMRERHGLILLEGRRLIQEAVDCGCQVHSLFFSKAEDLNLLDIPGEKIKIYKTPYNELKLWSELTTPPGIIGIFWKPPPIPESSSSLPLTIICDQLREPGNLGSMIRSCAGVGVRRVILTPGCTDMWDSKVLRGAAGGHFRIRIRPDISWEEISALVEAERSKLHVAVTQGSEDGSTMERLLSISPYWAVNYHDRHNFLVIGGETEGVSEKAYEVAAKTNGSRITIPLANEVDSLNSVSAASVIMFEIRRQLVTSQQ